MLSKNTLDRFKEIYKAQFGVDLNDIEAEEKARELITLYMAVLGGTPLVNNKNKDER